MQGLPVQLLLPELQASELSPEAIAACDGGVVLRSGRREWFQSFQCPRGLFLKKGFAPLGLIVEVLHSG